MERENQLSQVVFCPTHTMAHTCPIIIHALLVSFFFFLTKSILCSILFPSWPLPVMLFKLGLTGLLLRI